MRNSSGVLLSLLAGALAIGAVACGGGSSSSVTVPTAAVAEPTPTAAAPPAEVGATIVGTVQGPVVGSATADGVHALSSDLRVSVVGTALATTTDGSGRFVLSGVPAGNVQLHFEGPGVDARLDLEGLQNGETLTITVRCSGSEASMEKPDGGSWMEIEGQVDSVGDAQLVVAGKTVEVDGSTKILDGNGVPITLAGIEVGDFVEVKGTKQANENILAAKIKIENDGGHGGTGQHVEFEGKVESVDAPDLVVRGKTVHTDASTRIVDSKKMAIALADVKVGDLVEVDGTKQTDGSILASKIKVENECDQGGAGTEVEIRGTIAGLLPLTVAGWTVETDAQTKLFGHGHTPIALADLKLGDKVEVVGEKKADKVVLARRIQLEG